MAIFNSYVNLPEGNPILYFHQIIFALIMIIVSLLHVLLWLCSLSLSVYGLWPLLTPAWNPKATAIALGCRMSLGILILMSLGEHKEKKPPKKKCNAHIHHISENVSSTPRCPNSSRSWFTTILTRLIVIITIVYYSNVGQHLTSIF